MPQSIGTLAAKLTLDTSAFLGGFKSAVSGAKQYSQQLGRVGGGNSTRFFGGPVGGGSGAGGQIAGAAALGRMGMGVAGPAAAIAVAVTAAQRAVREIGEGMQNVDRNAKLSDRLGVANEMMQRLGVAANASGADVETLAKAMLHMGREIGSGGKPLDKRLFDVADVIAQIKDPAQRSAAAVRIFGKSGDELHALLTVGSKGIKRSTDAIDRFGLAITRIEAARVEAANDAIGELSTVLGGLRNKIAVEVSPAIKSFVDSELKSLLVLKNAGAGFFGEFARAVGIKSTGSLDSVIGGGLSGAFNPIGTMFKGLEMLKGGPPKSGPPRTSGGLGGAIGGLGSGNAGLVIQKGTLEAAKAISGSGGNLMLEIAKSSNQTLSLIERHTAAQARKAAGTPLRPSSIGGGRN